MDITSSSESLKRPREETDDVTTSVSKKLITGDTDEPICSITSDADETISSSDVLCCDDTELMDKGTSTPTKTDTGECSGTEFISSEFFKIEIQNLPTPISFPEARKLVQQRLDLQARKVKLATHHKHPPCIFATFPDEPARQRALGIVQGYEYRQHKLTAKIGKVGPLGDKKPSEVQYHVDMTVDDLTAFDQVVINAVAPLQHLPYSEQLELKHKEVIRTVKTITNAITNNNPALKPQKTQGQQVYKLHTKVPPVLPSSTTDGYRNKNEFTIGRHPNGQTMVGFRVSTYAQGNVHIGSPSNVKTVGDHVKKGVIKFETFLATQAPLLEPFDPVSSTGVFRTLTVRDCNAKRQLMFLLIISGGVLSLDEIDTLKKSITHFYLEDETVISFFLKISELPGQKERNSWEWIFGQRKLLLEVSPLLKFEISPDAFFQVNTQTANTLFEKIVQLGSISSDTSVIDVCCGTGTIGIASMLYGNALEVLGIELVESAIDNARANVEMNFVQNEIRERFKFYSGKAEDLIEAAGNTARGQHIVAIVDPPRSGLGSRVIAALRKNPRVQTIVYVACKLEACKDNFVAFGRPQSKKYVGRPFVPQEVVPVDMFPHTRDVECVVLFKRYKEP